MRQEEIRLMASEPKEMELKQCSEKTGPQQDRLQLNQVIRLFDWRANFVVLASLIIDVALLVVRFSVTYCRYPLPSSNYTTSIPCDMAALSCFSFKDCDAVALQISGCAQHFSNEIDLNRLKIFVFLPLSVVFYLIHFSLWHFVAVQQPKDGIVIADSQEKIYDTSNRKIIELEDKCILGESIFKSTCMSWIKFYILFTPFVFFAPLTLNILTSLLFDLNFSDTQPNCAILHQSTVEHIYQILIVVVWIFFWSFYCHFRRLYSAFPESAWWGDPSRRILWNIFMALLFAVLAGTVMVLDFQNKI